MNLLYLTFNIIVSLFFISCHNEGTKVNVQSPVSQSAVHEDPYYELVYNAEKNGHLIMKNFSNYDVMDYFNLAAFDTTGFKRWIFQFSRDCNLKNSITGYIGHFVMDWDSTGKMIHTLYELKSDCDSYYIQISYKINEKENNIKLYYFYRHSIDYTHDIILNIISEGKKYYIE